MGVRALMVGGGNMAEAIVGGAIDAGVTRPDEWCIAEPNNERRSVFEALGVRTGADARALLDGAGPDCQLWWGVKPQVFERMAPSFGGVGERVVVSIMAGVTTRGLREHQGAGVRAIRVMPNTPVRVRKGVSAIAPGVGTSEDDTRLASEVFGGLGDVIDIDEGLIDAFTGVAGSGPGYLFLVAEAMVRGAVEAGIPREKADAMVRGLFRGAGELLATSDRDAGALRRTVTSPGGTTAAGLVVLEEEGVPEAFVRAIASARDRGRELGGG
ncbi:MAG: pyrroline-5-carboxylate reductase [Planctomycetota bacterium]